MTERKHHIDEHATHHPDQASMHHSQTMDADAPQDVAIHGSAHAGHATDARHAAHAAVQAEHDGHAGHSEAMFRRPFWISLLLTIPVLIYAELFQELLGYTAP